MKKIFQYFSLKKRNTELSQKLSEVYFENSLLKQKLDEVEVFKKEFQDNQDYKLKFFQTQDAYLLLSKKLEGLDEINEKMQINVERKFREHLNDLNDKKEKVITDLINDFGKERFSLNREIIILESKEKMNNEMYIIASKKIRKLTKKIEELTSKDDIPRGKVIDQNQEIIKRYSKVLEEKNHAQIKLDHFEHLVLQYQYLPNFKKVERTTKKYDRKLFEKALPNNFSKNDWLNLQKEFGNKCALSNLESDVSFEHFIPISTGHGGTYDGNIIPLNKSLNMSKNNRNPFYWFSKNDFPVGFTIDAWDNLIKTLAKKNKLSVDEYVEFVNWCFEFPRTLMQIEKDGNISSIELWKNHILKEKKSQLVAI